MFLSIFIKKNDIFDSNRIFSSHFNKKKKNETIINEIISEISVRRVSQCFPDSAQLKLNTFLCPCNNRCEYNYILRLPPVSFRLIVLYTDSETISCNEKRERNETHVSVHILHAAK